RTRKMDWPVIWDPRQQLTRAWEVSAVPACVIINSQGEEVWRGHPLQLAEVLPDLLREATSETIPTYETTLAANEAADDSPPAEQAVADAPAERPQPLPRPQTLLNLARNYELVGRY